MRVGLAILALAAVAFIVLRRTASAPEEPRPAHVVPEKLTDDFELDPKVEEYVWEIERRAHHLQFELSPGLENSIRSGDPAAWERIFGAHQVEAPGGPGTRLDLGFASITRWEQGTPVAVRELIRAFHEFLAPHPVIDRCHVHIGDLSPAVYGDLDGEWTGSWAVELEARGADGSLHEFNSRFAMRFSHLPEQPGSASDYAIGMKVIWIERRTAPRPLFEEVTDRCGIEWQGLKDTHRDKLPATFHETVLLDYDRDGWVDLLVLDPPRHYLYRGLGGGRFEDVTIEANLLTLPVPGAFLQAATVADFDNDGYEDLVFDLAVNDGLHPVAYRNEGDGRFTWQKDAVLPTPLAGSATVFDFDRDGRVDLLRPNTGEPLEDWRKQARFIGDRAGRPSVLLRNRGEFIFQDVTAATGAGAGHRDIFAAGAADLDLDGDPDVVLANHMGENVLLINDGTGRFETRTFASPFGGFSMGMTLGDLDNDGDADAYIANMSSRAGHRVHGNLREQDYPPGTHRLIAAFFSGDEILRNDPGPTMVVTGTKTNGWAYGPAVCDLDGDGLLDVYVPAGYQSVDPKEPDG